MDCSFKKIMLLVLPLVTCVLAIIIAALCGKYLAKLLPFFYYGGYSKSITTIVLFVLILQGLNVIFIIIELIVTSCKKESLSYVLSFSEYDIVVSFILSIVIYVCVTAKLKYTDEIVDPRPCTKFIYMAYDSALKDAGKSQSRLENVRDWWENLNWNDVCKGAVTPILVVEIIQFIICIIWGIFAQWLFCFHLKCLDNVECLKEKQGVSNE